MRPMTVPYDDMPSQVAHALNDPDPIEAVASEQAHTRSRRGRLLAGGLLLLAVTAITVVWIERVGLLRGYLVEQVRRAGLPATFRVVSVAPGSQVLADVVVGDPAHPDLTAERIEIATTSRFGLPGIGRIRLVGARLHGRYRRGTLSFGSLDRLLAPTGSSAPSRLPDLDLVLSDARASVALDRGRADIIAAGGGNLRDGFKGRMTLTAPVAGIGAGIGACDTRGLTFAGRVAISGGKPHLAGPVRLADLSCRAAGLALGPVAAGVSATAGEALDRIDGALVANGADARFPGGAARAVHGGARLSYGKGRATVRYDLAASDVATPQVIARTLGLEGTLRAPRGLARLVAEGSVSGGGIGPGAATDALLRQAIGASADSLAAPLIARLREALRRAGPASTLAGGYLLRRDGARLALVAPRLDWRTGGGAPLVSLRRVQFGMADGRRSLSGTFSTGGPGMPVLAGAIARDRAGFTLKTSMARYDAGSASLALPAVSLFGSATGAIGIAGEARLSGALPGGEVRGLVLPIAGNWTRRGGLALWPRCVDVGFDALRIANLAIDSRRLQLCPPAGPGGAIVRSDAAGTRIAAGTPSLALTGRLGATLIRLTTGAVGVAVPGMLTARALDVALGPGASASRFTIARLDARIGHDIAGRFAGSQIRLAAVPLDLVETGGAWRYANGRLTIADGSLRLVDRERVARFQPLIARGASLTLAANRIVADAVLREPASGREVLRTHIVHDLAAGRGNAGLFVDGLTFDKQVQPDTLSRLALGVIANTVGTVRGGGGIDWSPHGVTSSGRFTTDSLDLAAAFGPAKGVAGTIVFTDLLGLVTPPHQALQIASVNPGIEARDGVLTYALRPGHVLAIEGARWPFLGGTLTLEPASMTIGAAEIRHFALSIEALDAARLVQQMDLDNLAVTGVFDGRLPLVIDQDGARIDGGALRSRAPGGNVSYVGALTYKNLSPMANFAFAALRSLDYKQMGVGVDGALTGEIVTRLRFSGVSQGAGAKRNFLTTRIGRLPIQFNVNVRAPFVQLISSFRSLWDPTFIRDPRELGLITRDGTRVVPPEPKVQPSASGPVR